MTANLKDQKGYIIEVQGYSPTHGQAGISTSQTMANSVVRYLVEKNDIPVYRIFVMGMGNAQMAAAQESSSQAPADGAAAKPYNGNRVEVSLMKNNVDQLAAANQPHESANAPANQPEQ